MSRHSCGVMLCCVVYSKKAVCELGGGMTCLAAVAVSLCCIVSCHVACIFTRESRYCYSAS